MNYLLDTHTFLWSLAAPEKLGHEARRILENPETMVFVSAVSAVEIAIKRSLGKLTAQDNLGEQISARGFQELPLRFSHGEALSSLPRHHDDPFDRMLIAQALVERLQILSCDEKLRAYPVRIIW
jgi:PIN domain nuclease of toxin-antitoxin system